MRLDRGSTTARTQLLAEARAGQEYVQLQTEKAQQAQTNGHAKAKEQEKPVKHYAGERRYANLLNAITLGQSSGNPLRFIGGWMMNELGAFVVWAWSYRKKASDFWRIVRSGKVTPDEYAMRMMTCPVCPHVQKTADGMYCGECRCGRWFMSRLDRKNVYKGTETDPACPVGNF